MASFRPIKQQAPLSSMRNVCCCSWVGGRYFTACQDKALKVVGFAWSPYQWYSDGAGPYLKLQGGMWRDLGRRSCLPVRIVRFAGQECFLAPLHGNHALVPSFDDCRHSRVSIRALLGLHCKLSTLEASRFCLHCMKGYNISSRISPWPWPMVKTKGSPRSREESNTLPSSRVPW